MNKPTKITPPVESDEKADKGGSLFERASGAFGFDKLQPARVPKKLPESVARRMPLPAAPKVAQPEMPDQSDNTTKPAVAETTGGEIVEGRAAALPVKRRDREMTGPAVKFSGKRHEVSRGHLIDQGLIDPDGGASTLLEEFRIVKRQILETAEERGTSRSRRVLICSPHTGEGKTFCAANLALSLAGERDMEVLLVDGDFAKPSIMKTFGIGADGGLMDALADPARHVEDMVVGTDIPGLWLLPAGKRTDRDSEYLASDRTWEVLGRLTRGAPNRIIVFDSPPVLAASPAAELAKHVGQALLLARADHTPQAALEDAADLLSGCDDLSLLLNDATFSPSGRRFGTYYGYGE